MKILFISVYYPHFLDSFYRRNKSAVANLNFGDHLEKLLDELFGDSDFYSSGVRENGQEATDIIANDKLLQIKWAKENKFKQFSKVDIFSKVPYARIIFKPGWVEDILMAQIESASPDVLYFQDIEYFSPVFIKNLRKNYFIIAQKASPIWRIESFKNTDLVFTSLPHFVDKFKSYGIKSEYLKLAFGKKVLKVVPKQIKKYNCTFIGGISRHHSSGVKLLLDVYKKQKIDVFGYGRDYLPKNSTLYKSHHGEVWGKEMYQVMMQSAMTINRHINVAGEFANNMRLFEATGSGTMLLTDNKKNIKDFFDVDKEVVVYDDAEDLANKIEYFTNNPEIRQRIAKNGQIRTLKDHNYKIRMGEMLTILKRYYK